MYGYTLATFKGKSCFKIEFSNGKLLYAKENREHDIHIQIGLFFLGAIIGGVTTIALEHNEILPKEFDGRWIAVAFALGGVVFGHYIDNKRECARIARELDQDRIRMENKSK